MQQHRSLKAPVLGVEKPRGFFNAKEEDCVSHEILRDFRAAH
jgi:hypothetical protein